jgi:hypothetical protein
MSVCGGRGIFDQPIEVVLQLRRVMCCIEGKNQRAGKTERLQTQVLCDGNLSKTCESNVSSLTSHTHMLDETRVGINFLESLRIEDGMIMVNGIRASATKTTRVHACNLSEAIC